ncbi:Bacitracin transport ATP-binding protein BcrA [Rubrobacter xylanophilus DSM 9941]|uniref:ABC transporter ATP-binding protein n=1 Tax=Rubrobacter xylanophilus TaxID=49319 RepID=UPI001C6446C3|nr:ATP-binding cassette domain-containing protein [Rubrobacter xylanophilus]QYJ15800.1 Bacitracin transport ATP-binding protein BcrA [Rubrobacter xylanophilus DSM 9941]
MNQSPPVETRGLTKRYGGTLAVDGLDLTVRRGEVYGFLGPNGAGKTTTLRMLLGLVRPTSGTASVLGEPPGSPKGLERVGALVESPAFYPYLSGRDNLRVLARYAGVGRERVEEALRAVELSGRAKDRFRKYSLGMKQRLGVAAALLKDPELLILDEPTNGLDPKGMAEMRELIKRLGRGHRTVLLSSHLLGEVEQVCDRIGVIRGGKLVAEGTVAGLRKGSYGLLVRVEPLEVAAGIVRRIPGVEGVEESNGLLRVAIEPGRAAEINRRLVLAGLRVSELRVTERTLEEVFLELTGEEER